jgi:hypothetical protein
MSAHRVEVTLSLEPVWDPVTAEVIDIEAISTEVR